jgi:hypothetical protein
VTKGPTRRNFLLCGGAGLAAVLTPAAVLAQGADPRKLTPFFRSMQLQGHIPGYGLQACPDYLKTPGPFLFDRVSPAQKAIPFVDSFSITRFLGGVREDWLRQFNEFDPSLGRASLDYVIEQESHLRARSEIVRMHLEPYLKAGYALSDVTVVLDNVPWALARGTGSLGPFGQNNPPKTMEAWTWLLRQLSRDLKQIVGTGVPNFKVGNEYDTKKNFRGSAEDYFTLYETSHRILRKEFPRAEIAPGEFTRDGHCAQTPICVYDTGDFLRMARERGVSPDYIPRSLNAFLDNGRTLPSLVVRRAVESYRGLGSIPPEIHQFGLLGQTFGPFESFGSDIGSRRAAWEFIALMKLREELRPRRIFHWDPFYAVNKSSLTLLNGTGFVRLLFDQYLGGDVELVPLSTALGDEGEAAAAIFTLQGTITVVIAAFSPRDAKPGEVEVRLPVSKPLKWRFVRTGADTNVFSAIKDDLRKAHNLRPEFAMSSAIAEPPRMAADFDAGRRMLLERQHRYEAVAGEELRWKPVSALPYSLLQSESKLRVALPPNEVLVLEAHL